MTHFHPRGHSMPDKLRYESQNPEVILHEIGLKPGDNFMDIGCGDGYFAITAAKIIGESGKVYGVDINTNAIEELKRKAIGEGLSNLEMVVGMAETTIFCDACADIVFFGINLHDFQDPLAVLKNAHQMLKPTGKLVDFDWKKIRMAFGAPFEIRFSEEKAKNLIENAGFRVETIKDIKPYNYLIIARPT